MDKMKLLPFKEMRDDQRLPFQQQPVVNPYLKGADRLNRPEQHLPFDRSGDAARGRLAQQVRDHQTPPSDWPLATSFIV